MKSLYALPLLILVIVSAVMFYMINNGEIDATYTWLGISFCTGVIFYIVTLNIFKTEDILDWDTSYRTVGIDVIMLTIIIFTPLVITGLIGLGINWVLNA